jgi:outer membrane protein OmpA-like peptidoglycan-associated protein
MDRSGQNGGGDNRGLLALLLLAVLIGLGWFFGVRGHSSGDSPSSTAQSAPATPAPSTSRTPATTPGSPAPAAQSACPDASSPVEAVGVFEVHFDFDKSEVRADDLQWLAASAKAYAAAAARAAQYPASCQIEAVVKLTVVGHADSAGPRPYNQRLSERRAATVTRELVARDVPESRIEASGVGEDDPKVPTPDNTPNAQNRRAGIMISVLLEAQSS